MRTVDETRALLGQGLAAVRSDDPYARLAVMYQMFEEAEARGLLPDLPTEFLAMRDLAPRLLACLDRCAESPQAESSWHAIEPAFRRETDYAIAFLSGKLDLPRRTWLAR